MLELAALTRMDVRIGPPPDPLLVASLPVAISLDTIIPSPEPGPPVDVLCFSNEPCTELSFYPEAAPAPLQYSSPLDSPNAFVVEP